MQKLVMWLLIIGGLNWGVYAITGWDIGQLFGDTNDNVVAKIIYVIVGLAAVAAPFMWKGSDSSMTSTQ